MTKRDQFWQAVRGVCIICVVLIHCKNGLGYQSSAEQGYFFDYWLVMRQLINFPVAVFLFLAGYFTKIDVAEREPFSYISSRGRRLLVPFLVWSSLYTLANVVRSPQSFDALKITVKLLLGLSAGPLYFMLVLMQLTVLTPFLIKVIRQQRWARVLFLLTPFYLIGLYSYTLIKGEQLPFYQTFFPAWFVFYYGGLWVKIRGFRPIFKKDFQIIKSVVLCLACLAFSILEAYWLVGQGFGAGFASSQIKASSFLYTYSIIHLLFVIRPYLAHMKVQPLSILGDYSFGIYFVHVAWIAVSTKLVHLIPEANMLPVYQFFQLVFVLFFSLASIFFERKILGPKLAEQVLGF